MITITINTDRNADWLYGNNDEWKDYVLPETFDENVVLVGNDRMLEVENASWWNDAKNVITDLDSYFDGPEFKDEYAGDYSDEQLDAVLAAYDSWNGDHPVEFTASIARILHPELQLEEATIRGYSQSDWQDVVYIKDSIDEDTLEAFYFGNLSELHYEDDSGEDFWDVITDDQLWEMERGDLKQGLREWFGIPADEEIKIRKFTGYTQTPNYEDL